MLYLKFNKFINRLGRINDDAHNKNHDYEGIHGWILIAIRILLFIYFEYNI
jgi:hypothetical protein